MIWLFVGPLLLLLVSLAALLPYESFRIAVRNSHRAEGARSARRTQRERYHLTTFCRSAILVPLMTLVLFQGAAFVVHRYLLPDTTLSEIFGEYHPDVALNAPDLEAWNDAIEANQRDEAFEAWQQAQGLAPAAAPSFRDALVEHWPLHLVYLLLPMAYLAWFFRRRYVAAARSYHRGVVQRSKRYALRSGVTP